MPLTKEVGLSVSTLVNGQIRFLTHQCVYYCKWPDSIPDTSVGIHSETDWRICLFLSLLARTRTIMGGVVEQKSALPLVS
jgi:hypothetical protein